MRLNFTKIFIAAAIVLAATVTSCKAPQRWHISRMPTA